MIKNTGKYVITILLVLILFAVNILPATRVDLTNYLGCTEEELKSRLESTDLNGAVNFEKNNYSNVTEISIKDKQYIIDGIGVGDSVESIYSTYNKDEIVQDMNHIWVGKYKDRQYGILTEYTIFVLDKDNLIQEIRIGYTEDFTHYPLPTSNKETEQLLQGQWLSEDGRIIGFNEGILEDSETNKLWEHQYYMVISPNKLFITRIKESTKEKVKIHCWIDKDKLYLFAIDKDGLPIKQSVEIFKKQN